MNMNPLQATWTDPRKPLPKSGYGILKAEIFVFDLGIEKYLAYEYAETVNGMEVWVEKPTLRNMSAMEEDVRNSLKKELGFKFDMLNFID